MKPKCKICEQVFDYRSAMRLHIIKTHKNHKFNCNICGKIFSEEINLDKHNEIIHNEQKYSCEQCCKTYALRESLKRHIKTAHFTSKHGTNFQENSEGNSSLKTSIKSMNGTKGSKERIKRGTWIVKLERINVAMTF